MQCLQNKQIGPFSKKEKVKKVYAVVVNAMREENVEGILNKISSGLLVREETLRTQPRVRKTQLFFSLALCNTNDYAETTPLST